MWYFICSIETHVKQIHVNENLMKYMGDAKSCAFKYSLISKCWHHMIVVCPAKGRKGKFPAEGRKQFMLKFVFQELWAGKFGKFVAMQKSF